MRENDISPSAKIQEFYSKYCIPREIISAGKLNIFNFNILGLSRVMVDLSTKRKISKHINFITCHGFSAEMIIIVYYYCKLIVDSYEQSALYQLLSSQTKIFVIKPINNTISVLINAFTIFP